MRIHANQQSNFRPINCPINLFEIPQCQILLFSEAKTLQVWKYEGREINEPRRLATWSHSIATLQRNLLDNLVMTWSKPMWAPLSTSLTFHHCEARVATLDLIDQATDALRVRLRIPLRSTNSSPVSRALRSVVITEKAPKLRTARRSCLVSRRIFLRLFNYDAFWSLNFPFQVSWNPADMPVPIFKRYEIQKFWETNA